MKYMLYFLLLACCSCNSGEPYINYKLSSQLAGDCTGAEIDIRMSANIAGERYQFSYCLDENFDTKSLTITRSGDSLLLNFHRNHPVKSYELTLDIDAYPPYRYLVLDGKAVDLRGNEN